ncbi:L-type lectin-domain containing receptor kinase IX.1 [Hibiscus syriacus]|uniref:L-type lectin-domain containing receptor kinase IX.1 n=1 Tax=Hibiscus syriacus TaxID=106335 RepID=A0A6A2Y4B4_HIBSY|nr:L-type lectin-domain containing receptor kinase IX.1-like [Hibiscus syriacus]KAE8675655.1 L-type lectin-domain containing receptor kinase IX.1 [Hibiscus syriacus]
MANPFSGVLSLLQLLLFTFILPCVSSISFNITRFDSDATDVLYQGSARPNVGAVEFTSLTYMCQVGRVIYAESVPIWDSETRQVTDFTTHFSFIIDTQGQARLNYAAGLAFFLAPIGSEIPPNSAGGFLGLFNTTTSDSSRNQEVHVEFDTFPNPEWDPSVEHVGININSISSVTYAPWNFSLYSEVTADAWISYNASTRNLSVTWSYQNSTSQGNSSLSHQIDLSEILPETAIVGVSAATSYFIERHQLVSWEFNSSLERKATKAKNRNRIRITVGLAVPFGVLIIGGCIGFQILFWLRRKRSYRNIERTSGINDDLEKGTGPRKFSYRDLASATNNFSEHRKLGEGGFGAVYRGYLNDLGMAVAVKRISSGSRQGRKEYVTEVKVISQLRHRNLVQLIGWCHDRNEFMLVYEFMPNGSLDSHLFGNKAPLTWPVRHRISLGLASAILYLHEEWEQCVVHRDIKSSNVMLDSSFNVKLGDFGLAKLMDHELGPKTTGLAGTLGYLAPEYISTGRASKESDVYSFGVVLLEIATGRKSVDPGGKSDMGLVEWIWGLYGKGELLLAVDRKLDKDFDEKQMECLMIVGLWCAHPDCNSRPSIRQAIHVLHSELPMPNLPVKMPVPMYHVSLPSVFPGSEEPSVTYSNSSLNVGR